MFQFSKPCIDITRVYQEPPPEVYDGLSFYIPCEKPLCCRAIEIGGNIYEVWSPNCTTLDFYPGTPLKESESLTWNILSPGYPDGRLGPKDWTIHPQHFSEKHPWWGFCQCPPEDLRDWRSIDAELVPLPLVWFSSPTKPGKGFIDADYLSALVTRASILHKAVRRFNKGYVVQDDRLQFLLDHRPYHPDDDDMQEFVRNSPRSWEELVIDFTCIQRGLREIEAWLAMMNYAGRYHSTDMTIPKVQPGRRRIGVWLNGACRANGRWLLRIGIIPVYVIHQFIAGIDFPLSSSDSTINDRRPSKSARRQNFLQGSRTERLNLPEGNPYLKVFLQNTCSPPLRPFSSDQLQKGQHMVCSEKHHNRSSTWAFRVRKRNREALGLSLEDSDDDSCTQYKIVLSKPPDPPIIPPAPRKTIFPLPTTGNYDYSANWGDTNWASEDMRTPSKSTAASNRYTRNESGDGWGRCWNQNPPVQDT